MVDVEIKNKDRVVEAVCVIANSGEKFVRRLTGFARVRRKQFNNGDGRGVDGVSFWWRRTHGEDKDTTQ